MLKKAVLERQHPVCVGVDDAGELLWVNIDMPRWQMELLRVHYHGDFIEQWMLKVVREKSDIEWGESFPYAKVKNIHKSWGD